MSEVVCPRCGAKTAGLVAIEPAILKKIKEGGNTEALPPQVCNACYTRVAGGVARGSVLLMREKSKEQKKLMLWKSRVNLIRKARQYMNERMFSDAAVTYEKYIRVMETVYDCKPGELTPEMFKDSARTQELTVVVSVFWDLVRIYDTNDKYLERMNKACEKLSSFLRFTPIYPDIIKKAEIFSKTARNQNVIKNFLKSANSSKGRCFIATSAYESPYHPIVLALTDFRDKTLESHFIGRIFVRTYYLVSPKIAQFMDLIPIVKPPVRWILFALTNWLHKNKS
jgi:hypothetical protein